MRESGTRGTGRGAAPDGGQRDEDDLRQSLKPTAGRRKRAKADARGPGPAAAYRRRAERRAEILDAACRAIAERGIGGARISDVAEAAGVSTPLVHYYFKNRSELLQEAFLHAEERAWEMESASGPTDPLSRIFFTFLVYLDGGRSIREPRVVMEAWMLWREMGNQALIDSALRPAMIISYRRWIAALLATTRDLQRAGIIPEDVQLDPALRRLVALSNGLGVQVLIGMVDPMYAQEMMASAICHELRLDPAAIDLGHSIGFGAAGSAAQTSATG